MTLLLIIVGCVIAAWLIPALIFGYAFGAVAGSISRAAAKAGGGQ